MAQVQWLLHPLVDKVLSTLVKRQGKERLTRPTARVIDVEITACMFEHIPIYGLHRETLGEGWREGGRKVAGREGGDGRKRESVIERQIKVVT